MPQQTRHPAVVWIRLLTAQRLDLLGIGQNNLEAPFDLLRAISDETKGKFQPNAQDIFATHGETTILPMPLWPYPAVVALMLYIGDVFLRRVRFGRLCLYLLRFSQRSSSHAVSFKARKIERGFPSLADPGISGPE